MLLSDFEPAVKSVILHGDLWSGNVGYDRITESPVIYDPSSYYGHGEADLGIARMFGGQPRSTHFALVGLIWRRLFKGFFRCVPQCPSSVSAVPRSTTAALRAISSPQRA